MKAVRLVLDFVGENDVISAHPLYAVNDLDQGRLQSRGILVPERRLLRQRFQPLRRGAEG